MLNLTPAAAGICSSHVPHSLPQSAQQMKGHAGHLCRCKAPTSHDDAPSFASIDGPWLSAQSQSTALATHLAPHRGPNPLHSSHCSSARPLSFQRTVAGSLTSDMSSLWHPQLSSTRIGQDCHTGLFHNRSVLCCLLGTAPHAMDQCQCRVQSSTAPAQVELRTLWS